MYSKGAFASYQKLDAFLQKHTVGLTYRQPYLQYFAWVDDADAVNDAVELEEKFISDFGMPSSPPVQGLGRPSEPYYNKVMGWRLEGEAEQCLKYVDDLGKLPSLKPRPSVTITIRGDFWLPGAEQTDEMHSDVYAWLSPSSNKACFLLNFPHTDIDDDFRRYRDELQADCPVKLEDKYFYVRKISDAGKQSARKAF